MLLMVKENVKLDAIENVHKTESQTASSSSQADVAKDVKTNVIDKLVTRTTEIEFSVPNAGTGEQYKIREKVTETKNDIAVLNEENERIISEQKSEIERLARDNSELRTKLNASLSEKTKTTTRASFWTYIVAAVIGAGSALMLRSWLKTKFRL